MSAPPSGRDRIRLRLRMIDWIAAAALDAGGVEFIDRGEIAARLQKAGLRRTASYDWIARAIEDGEVERAIEARRAELAALAAGANPDTPPAASDVPLPPPRTAPGAEGNTFRMHTSALVAYLEKAVRDAEIVRSMAFSADGRPRNARLLLHATEMLRRTLETAVKIQATLHEHAEVERFNRAIVETITQESPELARRVLQRLDQLAARVEAGGAV